MHVISLFRRGFIVASKSWRRGYESYSHYNNILTLLGKIELRLMQTWNYVPKTMIIWSLLLCHLINWMDLQMAGLMDGSSVDLQSITVFAQLRCNIIGCSIITAFLQLQSRHGKAALRATPRQCARSMQIDHLLQVCSFPASLDF